MSGSAMVALSFFSSLMVKLFHRTVGVASGLAQCQNCYKADCPDHGPDGPPHNSPDELRCLTRATWDEMCQLASGAPKFLTASRRNMDLGANYCRILGFTTA